MRSAALLLPLAFALAAQPAAQSWEPAVPEAVERRDLPPVGATRGLAQTGESALPRAFWQGMTVSDVRAHLEAMPLPHPSSALQDLLARILSASTDPPDGAGPGAFAALRLSALYRAGLVERLAELGGRLPQEERSPGAATAHARALLATGDDDAACDAAAHIPVAPDAMPAQALTDALVLRAYCAVLDGDLSGAELTVELARDRSLDAPLAFAVVDRLSGNSERAVAVPETLGVEDVSFLRLAEAEPADGLAERAAAALLAFLAGDRNTAEAERLASAERGARQNAVSARALASAYDSAQFAAEDVAHVLGEVPGPRQRALLFQALAAARAAEEKARLIAAFSHSAHTAGLSQAAARALAPELAQLRPEPGLSWFAETAVRLAALADAADLARPWLDLGGRDMMLGRWRVLMEIGGGGTDPRLEAATQIALAGGWDAETLHRLATAVDALGYHTPIPLWEAASREPQPDGGHLPETGHLSRLSEAVQRGQAGQAALLAVEALGPGGPANAHMIALGDAVRALHAVGLEDAARQVAFEALVARMPAPQPMPEPRQ